MDKANIIISIIIVLCIAAAVTAYGLTNSDSPIFSDLSSMASSSNTGNGIGNNSTLNNGSGASVATTSGSSGSGASSSGSDDSGSGYSSSSSSSSSSSGGSSYSSDSGSSSTDSSPNLSYSEAQSIADSSVLEEGCYAGSVQYSGGYWYFNVYDENGYVVDTMSFSDSTGHTDRGY